MSETIDTADWTQGTDAIRYQSCGACRSVWYFRRGFCPSCGAAEPQLHRASGKGVVYAASLVCRAATPEARAHVPYMIVLIDMAEGFRLMAHGDKALAIGDAVAARFEDFTDRRVPHFEKI
jgi:uncharacterized OB-fold protein